MVSPGSLLKKTSRALQVIRNLLSGEQAMPVTGPECPTRASRRRHVGASQRATTPLASATATPISGYLAIPITVEFQGNFYDLSDFLYRLRNLVDVRHGTLDATGRLFAIDTLSFDEAQGGFPQISATLVVDAFVYGTLTPATATPTTSTTSTTSTSTTTTASP